MSKELDELMRVKRVNASIDTAEEQLASKDYSSALKTIEVRGGKYQIITFMIIINYFNIIFIIAIRWLKDWILIIPP